jgi:hypothetical protein
MQTLCEKLTRITAAAATSSDRVGRGKFTPAAAATKIAQAIYIYIDPSELALALEHLQLGLKSVLYLPVRILHLDLLNTVLFVGSLGSLLMNLDL